MRVTLPPMTDPAELARELAEAGVAGLTIVWADNNGIPRSRTVPVAALEATATRGVGATPLLAVFDTHDAITYAYEGLSTPSGDVRHVPVLERVQQLAGQPSLAWAPSRVLDADGTPWSLDPRGALEAQVDAAAQAGLEVRAGFEIEFFAGLDDDSAVPAHHGPAYSPHALLQIDELVADLLRDLESNGLRIGQLHAEYGLAQVELSLAATDPLSAADDQLLARQTIHAAARANGLRASFAPLITAAGVGQGWHLHTSVARDGRNLLAGGPTGDGASWIAGLLRELPAIASITTPSVPSQIRLRPGYFAGAYAFWGVENREAALRYIPGGALLGDDAANVELKACDASAKPYLALAAVIAAGLAGISDGLPLADPINEDPGGWSDEQREAAGVLPLPTDLAAQEEALTAPSPVAGALGPERIGAFLAARRSDAAWAADRELDEIVAAHLWRY
ncbi:MAG: glutamine synthetase [Solirubrobacteraceae bacterium]|nr:glutamine synthetase [Solirubrobacteraceae bacterium]